MCTPHENPRAGDRDGDGLRALPRPDHRPCYHPPSMRKTGPILILIIGVLALFIDFFPNLRLPDGSSEGGRLFETKLGLDLKGGLRVEYQAQPAGDKVPGPNDLAVIRTIIESRVNSTGVSEPVITTQGSDRIVVELPGVSDPQAVRNLVKQTGRLDFVPLGTTQKQVGDEIDPKQFPALFSGEQLESAAIATSGQTNQRVVTFILKADGAKLFGDYTAANVGKYFAIVLDGKVISAPVINSAIPGGHVEISSGGIGGYPLKEAQNLVTVLQYGSLPFRIIELSNDTISATLGAQFLSQSLMAGAIGIGAVILFMLIYYRLPGAIASFALIYYSLVVLAVFRLVPVTLTLAGIAGFVLSIGMAVDANILIFERMKEEMRLGKSLPSAVAARLGREGNSIPRSNGSSLSTATI